MPRSEVTVAAALLLAALAGGVARAQEPEDPLACGPATDGDEATRVDRFEEHYQRGAELVALGEYQRAIVEFKAAYCILPTPEPLYAIGAAYVNLVDYEEAVRWFELYIAKLPDSRAEERERIGHRVTALRKLPARVRVATEPPGAEIVLARDGGEPVRGRANSKEPILLPAGRYRMTVALDGYEPYTEDVVAEIGQPYTYTYRLTPRTGLLRVTTDPPTARIFVDQKLVGAGSYVDRQPVGPHTIVAEAEGYEPGRQDTTVTAETTRNVHLALVKPQKTSRWELIAASTVFGSGASSVGAAAFGEGSGTATLFGLGGALVGFGGAYLGVPETLPTGTSSYIIGSAAWGAMEAFGVALTADASPEVISSVSVAGAVTGSVVAAVTAKRLDLSAGDAGLINSGALWGTATGALFVALFEPDDPSEPNRLAGPLMLAGVNFGLLGGAALAARYEYSRGHVLLIDLAGVAGAITGSALSSAFQSELEGDDRRVHFSLGGIVVGLLTGAVLTRHWDDPSAPPAVAGLAPTVTRTAAGDPVYGFALAW